MIDCYRRKNTINYPNGKVALNPNRFNPCSSMLLTFMGKMILRYPKIPWMRSNYGSQSMQNHAKPIHVQDPSTNNFLQFSALANRRSHPKLCVSPHSIAERSLPQCPSGVQENSSLVVETCDTVIGFLVFYFFKKSSIYFFFFILVPSFFFSDSAANQALWRYSAAAFVMQKLLAQTFLRYMLHVAPNF